jgi:cytochrome P450
LGRPRFCGELVAETIRYQTPVIHAPHRHARDAELAGSDRQGDKVVMYVSGNRDEA